MITRAKVDSVHNRRMVARDLKDKAILAKLFVDIGPRFKTRPGGYTRMLKIGHRAGDASEMVILELVGEELQETKKPKKASKPAPKAPATAPAEEKVVGAEPTVADSAETVEPTSEVAEPSENDDEVKE